MTKSVTSTGFGSLANTFLNTYVEGCAPATALRCPIVFKIGCVIVRRIRRARANLRAGHKACVAKALKGILKADVADAKLLAALLNRQRTYSDVTQGFRKCDLENALKLADNHCPTAVLILGSKREDETVMLPPVYLMNDGGDKDFEANKVKQHLHKKERDKSFLQHLGSPTMYSGKHFFDNEHEAFDVETSTPIQRVKSFFSNFSRSTVMSAPSADENDPDHIMTSPCTSQSLSLDKAKHRVAVYQQSKSQLRCDEREREP